ncbi:MAG: peptidylprolyl isomerase, partial [Pseudomonadota bacterium]
MKPKAAFALAFALLAASGAAAQPAPAAPVPSMGDILDHSPPGDWRQLDPENTIYIDLPAGRVIIELAPDYAPNHAANIKALACEGYFDDSAIIRAQDNYVVQWGRPEESPRPIRMAHATLAAEFDKARPQTMPFTQLRDPDTYAPEVGFSNGFPVARDRTRTWMTHC